MVKNVLLEIGTEEIPAAYIAPACNQMLENTKRYLEGAMLKYENISVYSTPRRLSLIIQKIEEKSPDRNEEYFGPSASAGKDSPAAKGFAGKHNVSVDKLLEKQKDKGVYFCVEKKIPGKKTEDVLKEMFPFVISKITFPKSMVWEPSKFRFARPIRTIIGLFGNKVVKFSIAGVKSSDFTYGLHTISSKKMSISAPEKYVSTLRNNLVLVDVEDRKETIRKSIESVAKRVKGKVILDTELLDEVNCLVEHPVAVLGSYDEKYLKLPDVVLINCMKKKQKYFAVVDSKGKLTNYFIGIRNGVSENQQMVKEGYERVLTARLSDAEFFYNNDTKTHLLTKYEKLSGIMFQEKLGSVRDKIERVKVLAQYINETLRSSAGGAPDSMDIIRACELAKSDLVSEMVFEYPELQGVIGSIYAKINGEKPEVAASVEEHYLPITVEGALPESIMGTIISIADKVDTLCGYFSAGLVPSGSQDPFGLRRISVGVLRILREKNILMTASDLVDKSFALLPHGLRENAAAKAQLLEFLKQRLENVLVNEGSKVDEVRAVLSCGANDIKDADKRLNALKKIRTMPDFEPLAGSFKRMSNILKQAKKNSVRIADVVSDSLLNDESEKNLFISARAMENDLKVLIENGEYFVVLQKMVTLKPNVDMFFEKVMVMVDDEQVRANRLAVLNYTTGLFSRLLDFSQLQPA